MTDSKNIWFPLIIIMIIIQFVFKVLRYFKKVKKSVENNTLKYLKRRH